jgi:hypothetical protein
VTQHILLYFKVDEELKNGQAKHSVGRESRGSHQTVKLWLLRNAKRFWVNRCFDMFYIIR